MPLRGSIFSGMQRIGALMLPAVVSLVVIVAGWQDCVAAGAALDARNRAQNSREIVARHLPNQSIRLNAPLTRPT